MAMSQKENAIRTFLEENPKWIGILFAAMMLLSQVGTVAAGGGFSNPGP
jgi:hypothetical protein